MPIEVSRGISCWSLGIQLSVVIIKVDSNILGLMIQVVIYKEAT